MVQQSAHELNRPFGRLTRRGRFSGDCSGSSSEMSLDASSSNPGNPSANVTQPTPLNPPPSTGTCAYLGYVLVGASVKCALRGLRGQLVRRAPIASRNSGRSRPHLLTPGLSQSSHKDAIERDPRGRSRAALSGSSRGALFDQLFEPTLGRKRACSVPQVRRAP